MRDTVDTRGFVRRSAMFALVTAAVLAPVDNGHAQPTVRAYLEGSEIVGSEQPIELILEFSGVEDRESFRGHVGTLQVTSWVDRTSMATGDTLTLQVEVDVEGYMRGLPDPEIEFPDGFEVLTPQTRRAIPEGSDGLSGVLTYIDRLVAVAEGTHEIPAVEMSCFDPETEGYGVSRGRPFTVTVVSAGEEARQG